MNQPSDTKLALLGAKALLAKAARPFACAAKACARPKNIKIAALAGAFFAASLPVSLHYSDPKALDQIGALAFYILDGSAQTPETQGFVPKIDGLDPAQVYNSTGNYSVIDSGGNRVYDAKQLLAKRAFYLSRYHYQLSSLEPSLARRQEIEAALDATAAKVQAELAFANTEAHKFDALLQESKDGADPEKTLAQARQAKTDSARNALISAAQARLMAIYMAGTRAAQAKAFAKEHLEIANLDAALRPKSFVEIPAWAALAPQAASPFLTREQKDFLSDPARSALAEFEARERLTGPNSAALLESGGGALFLTLLSLWLRSKSARWAAAVRGAALGAKRALVQKGLESLAPASPSLPPLPAAFPEPETERHIQEHAAGENEDGNSRHKRRESNLA